MRPESGEAPVVRGFKEDQENKPLDCVASIHPNQWIKLTMTDGSTRTCRFVRAGTWAWSKGERWWHIDHGAYGSEGHDTWLHESTIGSAAPTQRPALLLTFRDPFGRVRRVGRYSTRAEAEAAMRHRPYATDVRFEEVRRSAKPRERSPAAQAADLAIRNARGAT